MLRSARGEDWVALARHQPPAYWIGLTYEEDGQPLGLGSLFEGVDGRWWVMVSATCRRPVALWKAARQILETADRADVIVHAFVDHDIDGAERFLRRLGFRGTDEIIEGHRVWVRK